MNHQRSKFARFDTRTFERSVDGSFKSVRGRLKKVYGKMKTLENWRLTVLLACTVALAIDPLFLFIPVIDSQRFCFTFDKKLGAAVCVLRTFIDTFYVIHIIFHLITELIAPRSQVSLRGELIVHSKAIRKTRLLFHFIVDIFAVLPLPQVLVLTLIQRSASLVSKKILKWIILCQYLPRIVRIYPIFKEVTRASGTVAESKWIGAALNFFLYILHSYVFGAFWYVSAIEKKSICWHDACARTSGCNLTDLFCRRGGGDNSRFLNTTCPLIDPAEITNSTVFNFGMFIDALKSGVVDVKPRDLPRKFVYCFWWGLRNISALGQNLETSNSAGEIFFAVIICVSGLLLFAVLIGNVQKYLQSSTTRVDEMKEKKRDTEKWMSSRVLPEYLKERIRRYEDYKWRETRGTEEEALLRSLPKDLRLETKRYLYLNMLKRVPWLDVIDGWLLEAVCDRVKSVFYSAHSYIVREGDPVEEMLIVTRGKLRSTTGPHGLGGHYICCNLKAGDICGELLFNGSRLPTSTRTIMTLTQVEGFVLLPDDVKFVASHLNLFQRQKLKQTFRFYSPQWRSWAACFIQAAWREHYKRKLSKILRANENIPQGTQLNLGSTLYVSRFVSKALQNQRQDRADCSSSPDMPPHKPADLEFAGDEA
ncbi:PREDICTED: probable cyclic nucleotide-gated ion channel 12 [Camelina sativa]|uniref:Probable cyclic nucleotide-gated ion channel 12 n=1 Tax=Camelina sativa TaxID=90675 RepID=A0ABM0YVX2_CAMSA|nr:PREDICTED: probable cyclic nucleotide-gated ion channel 12 [Camelina sativa]XP_010506650.1 PREDICTED: probable cyclic nucleotide-gated ion channel 12 [Camelina sativa]